MAAVMDSDRLRGTVASSHGSSGTRGGTMDDFGKRLSNVESSVAALRADVTHLATEARLRDVERSLTEKIADVRVSLIEKIGSVETSMAERIGRVETSMAERIGRVETVLSEKIARLEGSLIKWMVATILSSVAGACAIAKFFS